MQNIKDILTAHGIEVEAEKLSEIEKDVLANYKTVAELDGKSEKLKAANSRVAELEAELTQIKDTNVESEEGRKELEARLAAFEADKAKREADAKEASKRNAFDEEFNQILGERKFANSIVEKAIKEQAFAMREQNPAMDGSEILNSVIKDEQGIWLNPQTDPKKMPKGDSNAGGLTGINSLEQVAAMSPEDINKNWDVIQALLESQK